MKFLIGLGNPRSSQRGSRHNLGFMTVDRVAQMKKVEFAPGKGDFWESRDKDDNFILIRPTTSMNNSGVAVAQVDEIYNIVPEDMMVIYDDMDLPLGTVRFRERGGAGGHHGMESIIYHLQTEDFPRLRLGINNDTRNDDDKGFVLSQFSGGETEVVEQMVRRGADGTVHYVNSGIKSCMNEYNGVINKDMNQSKEN